jgi:hypothetical protein
MDAYDLLARTFDILELRTKSANEERLMRDIEEWLDDEDDKRGSI